MSLLIVRIVGCALVKLESVWLRVQVKASLVVSQWLYFCKSLGAF